MKSYSSIWIHLIWTTKARDPLLHRNFRVQLFQSIKQDSLENELLLDSINGIEDHVHCLLRILPAQQLSDIVKQLKGASSRWINQKEFYDFQFFWQTGYGALSVSPADVNKIRQYIFDQEKHHKKWKLDEEIEKFKYYSDS
ncbi:MAG TPA: IS200/IS605 family transposase [Balneolaceae bacterium]